MSEEPSNRVHLALVEALGDPGALESLRMGWLSAPAWAEALDRVRAARFPELARDEAFLQVGRQLGVRFLSSPDSSLLRDSLQTMPPPSSFARLLPLMGVRLRQPLQWEWTAGDTGGSLVVIGARATPAEVTLGFIQALAEAMSPPPRVRLGRQEPERLEFVVEW